MKVIEVKVYEYTELSEAAKGNVIRSMSDINVDYDWWEGMYEDAKNIGLKIEGFDMDVYCSGRFIEGAVECASSILREHGDMCETYKTAQKFINERTELVKKYSNGIDIERVTEENEYDFDNECDDLEEDFRKSILEDYRIILRNEYEYLTSREAIAETIEANDYQFTEDGKKF